MEVKGVIAFDIDGTLFDTKPGILKTLEDVFKKFRLGDFDRMVGEKYIGPPIRQSLITNNRLTEDVATKAAEYYRKVYIESYIAESLPYEGAYEVLEKLKNEGYSLYVATMKTQKQVKKLFEIFDQFEGFFDEIMTAKEDGSITKADMLREIRYRNNGASVYMIGDTYGDYEASKRAYVNFVGVTYGYGFRCGRDYVFPIATNIYDIFDVIDNLSKRD